MHISFNITIFLKTSSYSSILLTISIFVSIFGKSFIIITLHYTRNTCLAFFQMYQNRENYQLITKYH